MGGQRFPGTDHRRSFLHENFHKLIHQLAAWFQQSDGLRQGILGELTNLGINRLAGGFGITRPLVEPIAPQENLRTWPLERHRTQRGKAEAGDHLPCQLRNHLKISTRSLGDLKRSEDHLLSCTPAKGHHQVSQARRPGDQAGIQHLLVGHETGVTTGSPSGKNGDFVHRIGSRQQAGHQGMPHLVVSDEPFFGTVLRRLLSPMVIRSKAPSSWN